MIRTALVLAAVLIAAGSGTARADPNALSRIVHGQCVPAARQHLPLKPPCVAVDLSQGEDRGSVVFKDRDGATQFLLIATGPYSGIEAPGLTAPGAPNFFAAAWRARRDVETALGRPLPRDDISLAINSRPGRTQNQLHIHIDCVRADVRDALEADLGAVGPRWAAFATPLAGHIYMARRVMGAELDANPFALLAADEPGARAAMGAHTLVVVGAMFPDGPGFVVLDHRVNPAADDFASGEELQDHACAVGHAGPSAHIPSGGIHPVD